VNHCVNDLFVLCSKTVHVCPVSRRLWHFKVLFEPIHWRAPPRADRAQIKIQLPERLTDKHHLLFTFFHVGCKDKGDGPSAQPPKQVSACFAYSD
jgi:hypothetical protein